MSINNLYCNIKIYKELYDRKQTKESLHSNPDNLSYYLFENKDIQLSFELIKKISLNTKFGSVELAIIGSSHYFQLDNIFTEILTCSNNKHTSNHLIHHQSNRDNFRFTKIFKHLKYIVSVQSTGFMDFKDFDEFERALLQRKDVFLHCFEEKSAITALHYKNTDKFFMLQTWHSYPEYRKVIFSETVLQ